MFHKKDVSENVCYEIEQVLQLCFSRASTAVVVSWALGRSFSCTLWFLLIIFTREYMKL